MFLRIMTAVVILLLFTIAARQRSELDDVYLRLAAAEADAQLAVTNRDQLLSGGRFLCRKYDPQHGCTYVFARGQAAAGVRR